MLFFGTRQKGLFLFSFIIKFKGLNERVRRQAGGMYTLASFHLHTPALRATPL